jgi:class 3 adenylate cyclase/tetratricopeptide (TPR) repeat protein
MKCRTCGHRNRKDAKFCDECGTPVSRVVPDREPRSYTPRHLAEKILTSRSALEGERKQVTVLFADIRSSMELQEGVDPEAWHRVMDRFFQILTEGVHRFEGTVNQYTGDGIMALFGAPIAHEDHAQRACHAALRLQEELRAYSEDLRRTHGLAFAVRMGLNSGEVVVGKIGDDLRMDYTAQGHTVGLAARMEQLAYPGSVYASAHTADLVSGFFRLRDLGEFRLKGVREPVRVFELEGEGGLRTRLDLSRARGFSRFVGRGDEMGILEAALQESHGGAGQVVGVVGEPGVGKSRLCVEFLEACGSRGVATHRGHGVAHGQSIPFLPVLEWLRQFFGAMPHDADQAVREKVAGRVLLLDESLRESLPLLFDFMGVPDPERPAPRLDPEARQRRLYSMVGDLLRARAAREPTVVLLDDLHWFDTSSDAFLEEIARIIPDTRALLVVNFRPEYRADWMEAPFYRAIDLAPLGPDAARELLDELLGTDPSLGELADRIAERSGGNPFFMEEVVQSLAESGALAGARGAFLLARPDEVSIPTRVRSILEARIDRLAEREKRTLQTASVIGKRFAEGVLVRVLDLSEPDLVPALRMLEDGGFVHREPVEGGPEYSFRHPLTQEVAYGAQLREARASVHRKVAEVLRDLHREKLDEHAALLAHHYEGAGELLDAASWRRRAARRLGTTDFTEAQHHWQKVQELLDEVPPSREVEELRLEACIELLNLSWRVGGDAEEIDAIFAQGMELGKRLGNAASLAILHTAYANAQGVQFGNLERYVEHTGEAARIAEELQDSRLLLDVLASRITALHFAGRLKDAITACNLVLEPDEELTADSDRFGFGTAVYLLLRRGSLWTSIGRFEEARRDLDRGLELARGRKELELIGIAHGSRVSLALATGDSDFAFAEARRNVEIAESLPVPSLRRGAQTALGTAHLLSRDWTRAAEILEQTVTSGEGTAALRIDDAANLAIVAVARAQAGDLERARRAADESLRLSCERGAKQQELIGWLALGWVLLRTDGAGAREELERILERASALVRETGGRVVEPAIHVERAELSRCLGDEHARRAELEHAHRLLTEMNAHGHAERLARELG